MFKKYLFTFIRNNYSEFHFNFLIRNYDEFNKKTIAHKNAHKNFNLYSELINVPPLNFLMFDWILESEIGFLQDGIIKFEEFKWIDDNFYAIPVSFNGIAFNWSIFLEYCLQFEEIKNLKNKQILNQKIKQSDLKFQKLEDEIKAEIISSKQKQYLEELVKLEKEKNDLLLSHSYF